MAITVPVVAPEFKVHRIRIPVPGMPKVNKEEVSTAGRTAADYLPPKDQFAYYAGLGALAAFGVIEWPVAAAIGVGTAIARRPQQTDEHGPPFGGRSEEKTEGKSEVEKTESTESSDREKSQTEAAPEAQAEKAENRKGRGRKS
ncbi:hypothetical protein NI17_021375 [Thermobifida halotolerans]|uniref:Uncharacterized protein n=1 Tax=Thermobifida halotolerans TaxID=483545 RepID=A0AA97M6G8_9ACTN|nr:hypothetical protein [Thermobifida halotolerans]UOE22238.1 hypothetical protein NI17_021375 [Thermobifida halotolerans]